MKNKLMKLKKIKTETVKSFVEENKIVIAAIGGIAVGIALTAILGNEKSRQLLRSISSSIADLSGKVANDLGDYKQLVAPLFAKSDVQGL